MRRNLIVAAVLAVFIAIVQVVSGAEWWVVLLSALIAFLVSLGVLAVADRFGRRD